MTSRERVKKTLNHEEPDRVVVDIGSTSVTGISASALARLRKALNLDDHPVKVHEPFQILGFVEDDVLKALGADVVGLWSPYTMFGYKNENWKPWRLFDGTEVLVGGGFVLSEDGEGNLYIHPGGDASAPPSGKLPKGGFYFDNIVRQEPIDESRLDGRRDYGEQFKVFSEEECRYYEEESRRLYEGTDFGIIGNFGGASLGDVALLPGPSLAHPKGIRDPQEWYIAHITHPEYIKDVFAMQTEVALKNLELYRQAVGDRIEAIFVSGTDFGTQRSEFISPDFYREFYKPFHKQINDWIHKHTPWKTFFHTCGSVVNLLDDLVDAGVDILNPVQCSAAGMDPVYLKEKYGKKLVFWGGGIDTQRTLPFGTAEEVKAQALERLRIFAPGGGYVFNAIHNIQQPTPIENILAMFEAVKEL
ncbi:MAG TPA: methyltransferase [Firmicutes bacterium]|nr:methyltransferase [Bacillota bacterium]